MPEKDTKPPALRSGQCALRRLAQPSPEAGAGLALTHRQFMRKYPEYRGIPEFCVDASGQPKRFLDFTLADLRAYASRLEARIARRERGAGAP
jgi:hypothetical protein